MHYETECLIKTVKKCFLKTLSVWLTLIKVTVWMINYQKGQYIYIEEFISYLNKLFHDNYLKKKKNFNNNNNKNKNKKYIIDIILIILFCKEASRKLPRSLFKPPPHISDHILKLLFHILFFPFPLIVVLSLHLHLPLFLIFKLFPCRAVRALKFLFLPCHLQKSEQTILWSKIQGW